MANARSVTGSSSHSSARQVQVPVVSPGRAHTSVQRSPLVTSASGTPLARASSAARSIGLAAQSSPGERPVERGAVRRDVDEQHRGLAVAAAVAHDEVGAQRHAVLGDAVRRVGVGRLGDGAVELEHLAEHPPDPAVRAGRVVAPLRVGEAQPRQRGRASPPGRPAAPA